MSQLSRHQWLEPRRWRKQISYPQLKGYFSCKSKRYWDHSTATKRWISMNNLYQDHLSATLHFISMIILSLTSQARSLQFLSRLQAFLDIELSIVTIAPLLLWRNPHYWLSLVLTQLDSVLEWIWRTLDRHKFWGMTHLKQKIKLCPLLPGVFFQALY